VQDELGGAARTLVDPARAQPRGGAPVSVDFAFPSPDGSRVAYGVSAGGTEVPVVHVVDVATGEVHDDRVPLAMPSALAWTPDSASFFFADADPDAPSLQLVLHQHVVGGPTTRLPGQPSYRHPVVMPQLSRDGRWLAAVVTTCRRARTTCSTPRRAGGRPSSSRRTAPTRACSSATSGSPSPPTGRRGAGRRRPAGRGGRPQPLAGAGARERGRGAETWRWRGPPTTRCWC
jgi:hypothetical protein